ncbi:hypothetical protein I8751_23905 [Nostocaceae cyanobacterium CENA357]|uniref:Uncharacterized protein n=1 Tax=Atlanticothrix silvestris CENA357 TaxID=1725252 RepID=A0A8J7HLX3_9CYAN|nr:hypothetical protein [Atlanticothrix silvestris]MBH8555336.1 hypothetical protein [Atlanticothrix silvestris CENA357]
MSQQLRRNILAVIVVPMFVLVFSKALNDKAYIEMFGCFTNIVAIIYKDWENSPTQKKLPKESDKKVKNS